MSGQQSPLRPPLDPFPYPQDPRSRRADATLPDGLYAYVQDEHGIVHVVPDGNHVHPKILGQARPAKYAGDFALVGGVVTDITNLSGTFQFDDETGLLDVIAQFQRQGLSVAPGAGRIFPADGSAPRVVQ